MSWYEKQARPVFHGDCCCPSIVHGETMLKAGIRVSPSYNDGAAAVAALLLRQTRRVLRYHIRSHGRQVH